MLSALLSLLLLPAAAGASTLTIVDVTVVDPSGPARPHQTVTVREGRVTAIERAGAPDKNAEALDGRGKFLIPGLWDMHVHLSWSGASALPVLLANGVTGVRDMGGRLPEIDEWRVKISAGLIVGPRIVRAGPMLNGQKFNSLQMVVGSPDEARGAVRALHNVGVDFIKVHRRVPRDSYFAVIDEAKKLGLVVVGHIPMSVTPEEASDARQATIEHTETLFEGTFSANLKEGERPDAMRRFRADGADKLFARFVKNKTIVDPTLVAYGTAIQAADPASPPDPRARYISESLKREIGKLMKPVSPEDLAEMKRTYVELREVTRQMISAGVTLIAGTDIPASRVPGFKLHEELGILVELGLTPQQALRAATLTPAMVLNRVADFGSVDKGKVADLVLLDANPLDDIRNTQRISAVVADGRLFRRADLDRLLREAEQLAKSN